MLFAPEICLGKALVCIGIVVSSESKLLLGFDLMGQKKPVVNLLSEVWSLIFQFL